MAKLLSFREPVAPEDRYKLYVRYCHRIKIKPLSFEAWLRESSKIPESGAN
jgi:hypothetical protein